MLTMKTSHQRSKFMGKYLCRSFFYKKVAGLRPETTKKETPIQKLPCEFCENFKDTIFTGYLRWVFLITLD